MALPRRSRRAYIEARARRLCGGEPSPNWHGSETEVQVWMMAMELGQEENLSPWDALLLAVKRRAARVRWCDSVAEKLMETHRDRCGNDLEYGTTHDPDIPPDEVRKWLVESRNEERLMTRAAKMAVDAGVADAMIRRAQREGQIMSDALLNALDVLNLTQDQRLLAISKMHEVISAGMPQLGAASPRVIDAPRYTDNIEDIGRSTDRDDGDPDE